MYFSTILLAVTAAVSPTLAQTQQPIIVPQETISQPLLGFGTWNLKVSPENTSAVVSLAIQTGYRQIDCAAIYGNEKAVGKGIADGLEKAKLNRNEIWVTSKLWNDHHGDYETVEEALNQTLKDLGLEYVDLYLMHWPVTTSSKEPKLDYVKTWKSMANLPKAKVLNVGVSNFSPEQLRHLVTETGIKPAVHQMEMHPYLQQTSWLATHQALGISVTAYSPLGNSNPTYDPSSTCSKTSLLSFLSSLFTGDKQTPPPLLKNPTIQAIADRRKCTTAQVALSWGMGRGTSVIPKSKHEKWIVENYESLKCELGVVDLVELKKVGVDWTTRYNNPSKGWGVKLFEGLEDA
ncbi:Aldo/keto reductase [Mollisia scopiformis]|uniref:Aldo/keto reductase n=1 Tax=Mollisia scopiformis TaxID=149040 RepID=A0A132BDS7_MOLSC|nr:Aldo/keto reductase [Mollisia scopiformis]KUJ10149.1 Aldo/keto reductase [Mollisia scopiformis]